MTRLARDAYGTPLCLRENREAISALVPLHVPDAEAMAKAAIAAGDNPDWYGPNWVNQMADVLAWQDFSRRERERELLERANVSEGEIARVLAMPVFAGRSGSLRPEPKVSALRVPAAIAERKRA